MKAENNDSAAAAETATIGGYKKVSTSLLADCYFEKSFPQGCKFSPDGLCILTRQENQLLLYNTPTQATDDCWKPALKCEGGDSVRSYAWYPHMNSSDPSSCCFLGVSR